jgi:hypothetical protein
MHHPQPRPTLINQAAGAIITRLHPASDPGAPRPAPEARGGRGQRRRAPGAGPTTGAAPAGGELVIGWAELEGIVLDMLPPGVVEWGTRVTELREQGGRAKLTVESREGAHEDEAGGGGGSSGYMSRGVVSAAVAVVADGALSAVSAACCPPGEGAEFQVTAGGWNFWGVLARVALPPVASRRRGQSAVAVALQP